MTTLRAGGATHVGQVRSSNQDSFVVLAEADLYGVADGMGGHNGGEVASKMAVEALEAHAGEPSLENLKQAARIGNRTIFEKAGNDKELHGMGTTLCAVRVVPGADGEGDEIAWINVGDSRVYLFRDDALIQLSRDHSLVEDLLRDGQLTEEEAAVHPKRNIITRALGIDVDVDVDGSTVIPFNGDRYLLCSDGLFGEVSSDQISSVLRRLADPKEAADELVRLANEGGGRDNITVVIVEVVDDDGRSLRAAEALAAEQSRLKSREAEAAGVDPTVEEPAPEPVEPEPYVPVFADRKSSLPDADVDYGAEVDSPYAGMEGLDSKRFTWRVVAFAVALLAIATIVVGSLIYFDRENNYYVTTDGPDTVTIFKGSPDGYWIIGAERVQSDEIPFDDLSQPTLDDLERNPSYPTERQARERLMEIGNEARDAASARADAEAEAEADDETTSTTTTSTTTTTRPTTTTAPPTTAAPTP
jgi:protein phosphatase